MSDGKNGAAKTKRTKKDDYLEMLGRSRLAAGMLRGDVAKAKAKFKKSDNLDDFADYSETNAAATNNAIALQKDLDRRSAAAGLAPKGYKKGGKVRGSGCCKRTKKCKMY